jgi:DNA-binding YbaB/EbfC family protein
MALPGKVPGSRAIRRASRECKSGEVSRNRAAEHVETIEETPMDIMKMMKQASQLQSKMQQMQQDLAALEVEGQSGGGMVTVRINGKFDTRGIKIDPSLLKPEDAEMLEDLIIAALSDAKAKAENEIQAKMQEVTGGLPLPPGLKLF